MKLYHRGDIKLRINSESNYICRKPSLLFITNFDYIFVYFIGEFDMRTGKASIASKKLLNITKIGSQPTSKKGEGFYETPKYG